MLKITHKIKDPNGIHARPAGLLATECKKFKSQITVEKDGKKANAVKIFEIMSLCVKGGEEIVITIDGDDETQAFDALAVFLEKYL